MFERGARVRQVFQVRRFRPVLQVREVRDKRRLCEELLRREVVEVKRVCEGLHKLEHVNKLYLWEATIFYAGCRAYL